VDAGRLEKVTLTHKEIFERYMYAGAISRNPEAVAAMFTEDGVYEAPLIPDGHRLPRRLAGRDAIRAGLSAFHRELASQGTDHPGGRREPVSLVQIFRRFSS